MTDFVAFFAPTPPPQAAGAGARAPNETPQGGGFADALAALEAAAQESTLLPTQLPQALTQTASALSAKDLAAQLQAIANPKESNGVFGAEIDPALAALLTALQVHMQPTPETTAKPAITPAAVGLRGSIPLQEEPPAPAQIYKASETAVEHATAPVALLTAVPRAKPTPADPAVPARNENAIPAHVLPDGLKGAVSDALPQGPAQSGQTYSSDASLPPRIETGAAAAQTLAASPPSFLPTLIDAQTMSATVAAAPQTAVPLDALAVHIARKFEQGMSRFEIRLHPAELGQLDISLSIADDGRVQAVLRAERTETLDILQRDARFLEQQLRLAGLEVGSNALSFSLSSGNGQRQAPFVGWPAFAEAQDAGAAKQEAASTYFAVRRPDGLDIRV